MTAIGTVATLYHAASGDLRTILRKADYYTISLACMAMAESLHPQQRGPIEATAKLVSIAALPFRPTAVTACHAIRMEVKPFEMEFHTACGKSFYQQLLTFCDSFHQMKANLPYLSNQPFLFTISQRGGSSAS